ncbi:MAG: DUF3179 domain-containing protein [Patescibacteria group bacterium]
MPKTKLIALLIAGLTAVLAILLIAGGLGDDSAQRETTTGTSSESAQVQVDSSLRSFFPSTDFANASVDVSQIISGGPGKDGIPALLNPVFDNIRETEIDDSVQAIVYEGQTQTRVYPYNILNWHEIVNDTVDGKNIAVTFCPLCGSALIFDRDVDNETIELRVSGYLRESNMIMYDVATETLWQQATGEAVVGQKLGTTLDLVKFQLLTVGEIKQRHPDALILSTNTGHDRNYDRNPYAGYDENDRFFYRPSEVDTSYPIKEIFAAFRHEGTSYALPWERLTNGETITYSSQADTEIVISKQDGELTITSSDQEIPFYFEMWFSWAAQHQDRDSAVVINEQGEAV